MPVVVDAAAGEVKQDVLRRMPTGSDRYWCPVFLWFRPMAPLI